MRCGLALLRRGFVSFQKEMKIFGRPVRFVAGAVRIGRSLLQTQNLATCLNSLPSDFAGVPFDGRSTPPDPLSWSNNGTGGIRVHSNGTAIAYTGDRAMRAGDSIVFRFSLMVTPTRPLNLTKHWGERYFQAGGPVDYQAVADGGATVLNSKSSVHSPMAIQRKYGTRFNYSSAHRFAICYLAQCTRAMSLIL